MNIYKCLCVAIPCSLRSEPQRFRHRSPPEFTPMDLIHAEIAARVRSRLSNSPALLHGNLTWAQLQMRDWNWIPHPHWKLSWIHHFKLDVRRAVSCPSSPKLCAAVSERWTPVWLVSTLSVSALHHLWMENLVSWGLSLDSWGHVLFTTLLRNSLVRGGVQPCVQALLVQVVLSRCTDRCTAQVDPVPRSLDSSRTLVSANSPSWLRVHE